MKRFKFVIEGEIEAQDGIGLYTAQGGETTGLKLPDGSVIKFWARGERIVPLPGDDERYDDLSTKELATFGIQIFDYTERHMEEIPSWEQRPKSWPLPAGKDPRHKHG